VADVEQASRRADGLMLVEMPCTASCMSQPREVDHARTVGDVSVVKRGAVGHGQLLCVPTACRECGKSRTPGSIVQVTFRRGREP